MYMDIALPDSSTGSAAHWKMPFAWSKLESAIAPFRGLGGIA